jgi:hypothetical protein
MDSFASKKARAIGVTPSHCKKAGKGESIKVNRGDIKFVGR